MLDPLSALGVVSNVVQLVSFTADIIAESRAFVQGGAVPSCESIAQLVEQQQASYSNISAIETAVGALNRDEQIVKDYAERCTKEGRDLMCILDAFGPRSSAVPRRKLGSAIVKVAKARWKRGDIEQRRQALSDHSDQLNLALVGLIRRDQSLHFAELREALDCNSDADQRRILDAKEQVLDIIEQQRQLYDASTKETLTRLNDLAVSASETRNTLLTHQIQTRDEILNESIGHRRQTTELASGVANGFAKLAADLEDVQNVFRNDSQDEKIWRILQSLKFPDMQLRRDTITDAHSKTFEWIFSSKEGMFTKWLSGGGGIFWINGKAGSGKSTLMKFITGDERTRRLLLRWAGNRSLFVVDFYFWYLGTPLQKSEEGLLRSIIYQLFHTSPQLIPAATPLRWANASNVQNTWSLRELRQVLDDIATRKTAMASSQTTSQANRRGSAPKLCFFIDGLDEYHADQQRLVQMLQDLSRNQEVKICVSSRPWNVFDQAFGSLQEQLVLEDLTRKDITLYVRDELRMGFSSVDGLPDLADEIATKAQGVFLSVYLTVRSIREGIIEGDTMALLRERVAHLPSDLGKYFQLILSRVHPVYKKSNTMTALYMAMSATREEMREEDERSSLRNARSFVTGEKNVTTSLTRSFLNFWMLRQGIDDRRFGIHQQTTHVDSISCRQMARHTRTFLSAICKDLVYLPSSYKRYTVDSQVEFLHRTVYEFLESDEMRHDIEMGTIPHVLEPGFNVNMALARLNFVERQDESFVRTIELIRRAAGEDFGSNHTFGDQLLSEIERVALCNLEQIDLYAKTNSTHDLLVALIHLFKRGQYEYATQILRKSKSIHDDSNYTFLLHGVLGIKNPTSFAPDAVDETFLAYLLSFNVNVNAGAEMGFQSAWQSYLDKCMFCASSLGSNYGVLDTYRVWKIVQLLLQHGADLQAILTDTRSAAEALKSLVPSEHQEELHRLCTTGLSNRQSRNTMTSS